LQICFEMPCLARGSARPKADAIKLQITEITGPKQNPL
jgi:hypothetical protein